MEKEIPVMKEGIPAVAKMADLWGKLYYAFAKGIIDQLGNEKGKELIISCIKKYAKMRGEAVAEYVKENNLSHNVENFVKYYDSPWSEIQKACLSTFPDQSLNASEGTTFCPYYEIWRRQPDGKEIGLIYCEEFHKAMWKAYHPDLKVDQDKIMTRGDDMCTFATYMEGKKDEAVPFFDQKKEP